MADKYKKGLKLFTNIISGTVKTSIRVAKAIDRDNKARAKNAVRVYKSQQKALDLDNAKAVVEAYEGYIMALKSLHLECSDEINWIDLGNLPEPVKPHFINKNEKIATERLNSFKPSFIDKLLKQSPKKIKNLEFDVKEAIKKDTLNYQSQLEYYVQELDGWKNLKELSEAVLNKEVEAYRDALNEFNPFQDINDIGSEINLNITPNLLEIDLSVRSKEIIPKEERKLTSTGKLTVKELSQTKFNELYQDYVCSAVLRISREVFAILPINKVLIHAISNLINTTTGKMESQAILSVLINRDNLMSLNMTSIDPSDSMKNFLYNMKFTKAQGFNIIDKIDKQKHLA